MFGILSIIPEAYFHDILVITCARSPYSNFNLSHNASTVTSYNRLLSLAHSKSLPIPYGGSSPLSLLSYDYSRFRRYPSLQNYSYADITLDDWNSLIGDIRFPKSIHDRRKYIFDYSPSQLSKLLNKYESYPELNKFFEHVSRFYLT